MALILALAGFRNSSGDAIIYLHTDQQDPQNSSDLIKKHEGMKSIRSEQEKVKENLGCFDKNCLQNYQFSSDINLPVQAGDYKLISKKALQEILKTKEFGHM